ncbi:hypothetical protein [Streptomyces sp. NPDC051000]|uniref:hypothetical protein n=1 Tax=Streptomyces sp. NPDC051000 TaxID=3155520 RepID=UPI0033C4EFC3
MPYQAQRSHSMGAERHDFRLGPRLGSAQVDVFEVEHHIELPGGRMVTGYADGFRRPNVSSAHDFLSRYERRLNPLGDGKDNKALGLTSPAAVATALCGPRVRVRDRRS